MPLTTSPDSNDDHGHDDHAVEPPRRFARGRVDHDRGCSGRGGAVWFVLIDVGFMHHDARIRAVPMDYIRPTYRSRGSLRIDTLTAVMLVVSTLYRRSCICIRSAIWTRTRTGAGFFSYLSLFTFVTMLMR